MSVHYLSIKAYSLLHIKAYSPLQEVCINCFKSKYIFVILINGWVTYLFTTYQTSCYEKKRCVLKQIHFYKRCVSIASIPNICQCFTKFMGHILVHNLSIKASSILQEVCINCFKSKCMLIFYKMDGLHVSSRPKHQSLFTSTYQH